MSNKNTLLELVEKIKCAIEAITEQKRRGLVINWLTSFCRYLHFEKKTIQVG